MAWSRPDGVRGGHLDLAAELKRLDGKGYKAYKDLGGGWELPLETSTAKISCILFMDHVQGDPYAAPSRMRLRISRKDSAIPTETTENRARRVALEDYLTRVADRMAGRSGVRVDVGGQEVLPRTSCMVNGDFAEFRLAADLPAKGRRIKGGEARRLLLEDLPEVARCLLWEVQDQPALWRHLHVSEDQVALRSQLRQEGLVAFVGQGSVLPRASGVSDRPLSEGETLVVPFESPESMLVTLDAPHAGSLRGMGIPAGVTVIAGGGFHGKSTLLRALERGVYNHIPGDGREQVVTVEDAVKIRAEDGRSVTGVDISPFIDRLPFGKDTHSFSTPNASGSTSQAANIMEALEIGTEVLLIDEDTSATNFMVRDETMRRLVPRDREPITPFIDQVRYLAEQHVSTIVVMGGSGEYLRVADVVIVMDTYRPYEMTNRSRDIVRSAGIRESEAGENDFFRPVHRPEGRSVVPTSIDPYRGRRRKIKLRGMERMQFGGEELELGSLEQLVDASQLRAVGEMLVHLRDDGYLEEDSLPEAAAALTARVEAEGLDILAPYGGPKGRHPGDFAMVRSLEVAAALNRLRTLRVKSM